MINDQQLRILERGDLLIEITIFIEFQQVYRVEGLKLNDACRRIVRFEGENDAQEFKMIKQEQKW